VNIKAKKALDQLGALPGMSDVKSQVEQMTSFARVSKLRERNGLKAEPHSNHMVFTGNPGTGKTTAARLIGQAFAALGLLKSYNNDPPFVEVHHADFVSRYVGDEEKRIKSKFQEAKGGVLFIDEAYTLLGKSEAMTSEKTVGAIVQMLEDMRDEIVVIVAGYPEEMEKFLDCNPGLRSRFSNVIHFPDYETKDLIRIAEFMCSERDYKMTAEFRQSFAQQLKQEKLHTNFGNARTVRNLIEQAIKRQSVRVGRVASPGRRDLILLTGDDIKFEKRETPNEKIVLTKTLQKIQDRLEEIEFDDLLA
jgi:stage V sporulation protein K